MIFQRSCARAILEGAESARILGNEHKATTKTQELLLHSIADGMTMVLQNMDSLLGSLNSQRASEIAERITPVVRIGQGSGTMDLHDVGGKLQWVHGGA